MAAGTKEITAFAEEKPVAVFAHAVDLRQVGVVQPGDRLRLSAETPMRFSIGSGESDALRSSTQVPLKLTEAIPDETKASKAMKVAKRKPCAFVQYRHPPQRQAPFGCRA